MSACAAGSEACSNISSALMMMTQSTLLKSCATLVASRPTSSERWASSSTDSARRSRVMSCWETSM